jgi:hypothetical protein
MLAPMAFCLTITSMFLSPMTGERSESVTKSEGRIGSKTNVCGQLLALRASAALL